eukprot:TRINITY_DN19137_c0_g1_i4.p1 TRINITY_DN19137_c0_g1~~TRINITY_DN19137_c0_g1_i4.p1  ORF type:complete len:166 (+),score=35.15 TRINITY_DN19137_c0_g1_i4:38-535(+)
MGGCSSHACCICNGRERCGWGKCCAKMCGWKTPDVWHDKFTHKEYEQAIYENVLEARQVETAQRERAQEFVANRHTLKDGDVIAFVGSSMADNMIRLFGSSYGHVAIVCNSLWSQFKKHEPERWAEQKAKHGERDVLMVESFASHHGNPVLDAIADEVRSGTQVR